MYSEEQMQNFLYRVRKTPRIVSSYNLTTGEGKETKINMKSVRECAKEIGKSVAVVLASLKATSNKPTKKAVDVAWLEFLLPMCTGRDIDVEEGLTKEFYLRKELNKLESQVADKIFTINGFANASEAVEKLDKYVATRGIWLGSEAANAFAHGMLIERMTMWRDFDVATCDESFPEMFSTTFDAIRALKKRL